MGLLTGNGVGLGVKSSDSTLKELWGGVS